MYSERKSDSFVQIHQYQLSVRRRKTWKSNSGERKSSILRSRAAASRCQQLRVGVSNCVKIPKAGSPHSLWGLTTAEAGVSECWLFQAFRSPTTNKVLSLELNANIVGGLLPSGLMYCAGNYVNHNLQNTQGETCLLILEYLSCTTRWPIAHTGPRRLNRVCSEQLEHGTCHFGILEHSDTIHTAPNMSQGRRTEPDQW